MTLDAYLADAWARLPDYLGSHVLVSLTALAIGLGISLPVAIARGVDRSCAVLCWQLQHSKPFRTAAGAVLSLLLALAALSERALAKGSRRSASASGLALALYSMRRYCATR
jgi:osmoprotectant transport system permease protein